MKIHPVGAEFFQADEAKSLSAICNAPKKTCDMTTSNFYVFYPSANISYWNRLMKRTLEF
jgi:hypothetical protein